MTVQTTIACILNRAAELILEGTGSQRSNRQAFFLAVSLAADEIKPNNRGGDSVVATAYNAVSARLDGSLADASRAQIAAALGKAADAWMPDEERRHAVITLIKAADYILEKGLKVKPDDWTRPSVSSAIKVVANGDHKARDAALAALLNWLKIEPAQQNLTARIVEVAEWEERCGHPEDEIVDLMRDAALAISQ